LIIALKNTCYSTVYIFVNTCQKKENKKNSDCNNNKQNFVLFCICIRICILLVFLPVYWLRLYQASFSFFNICYHSQEFSAFFIVSDFLIAYCSLFIVFCRQSQFPAFFKLTANKFIFFGSIFKISLFFILFGTFLTCFQHVPVIYHFYSIFLFFL